MKSQRVLLLEFLMINKSITEQQAKNLKINRLSSLINRLRNQGHVIDLLIGWGDNPSMYIYNKKTKK